jgi:SnoaL-like protein
MGDREQIIDLVHRYSDAVTRKDRDQWAATWAADAHWDLGKGRVTAGRDAIVEFWQTAVDGLDVVVQLVHNGTVDIDGDNAKGRWYVTEHLRRANGALGILLAWYDDEYTRVDGAWLFTSRTLARLYHGAPDLTGDWTPQR